MSIPKPYRFWLVVGALVAVELGVYVLSLPDVDVIGDLAAARKTKLELDKEYASLRGLHERSLRQPTYRFDAERPGDIQQLVDQYLITPAWKPVLEKLVDDYQQSYVAVAANLAARSRPLVRPVAETADKLEWYTAYQKESAALLQAVHREGRLELPAGPVDFADDAKARDLLGLYTKASDYPDLGERPRITARLRAVEQVVAALRRAQPVAVANPVAPTPVESLPPARIAALAWDSGDAARAAAAAAAKPAAKPGPAAKGAAPAPAPSAPAPALDRGNLPLGGELARLATAWRLQITLTGSLPAVLAAEAALEHGDPEGPVLVVTGLELRRKESFRQAERKDAPAEDVRLQLSLLVLDFSNAPAVAAAAVPKPAAPATAAAPKPAAKP